MGGKISKEKSISFWVIINWKDSSVRVRKTEPKKSKIGTYEIPVQFDLDVVIPEEPEMKAEGTIELGRKKVSDIQAKRLKES